MNTVNKATIFKDRFLELSKLMGLSEADLCDQLGKYDDIEKDSHRAFVWYKDLKASFYIGNDDVVGNISAPKSDAYGRSYLDEPEYFSIDGIKQGMSKSDVERLWGEPDWKVVCVWAYKDRGGITRTGEVFELCITFKEINGSHVVDHFESRFVKNAPPLEYRENSNQLKEETSTAEASASIFVGLITLLKVAGVILHIWTIVVAYQMNGLISSIVSFFCPILAEIYFFFRMIGESGTMLNPYSTAILAFALCYAFAFICVMAISDNKK